MDKDSHKGQYEARTPTNGISKLGTREGSIEGYVEIIKEQDERREYEINGTGQPKKKERRRWRQEGSRR
jgi:hypothetical protein